MADNQNIGFRQLIINIKLQHLIDIRREQSNEWFMNKVEEVEIPEEERNDLIEDIEKFKDTTFIGNMYTFRYDPKHKDKLPYYDEYPLVIPIRTQTTFGGGFTGLNLHYLPPELRGQLFDELQAFKNNDKYDQTTRLLLEYKRLKSLSRVQAFKPTVKRYLNSHLRSKFIYIDPNEWKIALFLPTERFIGATKEEVWKDSRRKI